MHPTSNSCDGSAGTICCYVPKGEDCLKVELVCDAWVTQQYQSGNIRTFIVWNCRKKLNRHRLLVKWWLWRMRKTFLGALYSNGINERIGMVRYRSLYRSI
jgi:hypothetical protein